MDRDEFYRMLEEPCCYNVENFIYDREWASICGLSHISGNEKEDDLARGEKGFNFNPELNSIEKTEEKKTHKNVFKAIE